MLKLIQTSPNDPLEIIVRFFNPDIADEYVVSTKTKRYHWNLIDSRFHDLHQFLKVQYEMLDEMVDDLAERIQIYCRRQIKTLKDFIEQTQ